MSALYDAEEADREAAERLRVDEWAADHQNPLTAALQRAETAEAEAARLRALLAKAENSAEYSSPETAVRAHKFLWARREKQNGTTTASIREIAEGLSVGRNTAHRAIARLLEMRHIEVARRGTGDGYATTYNVTDPFHSASLGGR